MSVLSTYLCLCSVGAGQVTSGHASSLASVEQMAKPEEVVLPITPIVLVEGHLAVGFGTGFCLDPICRFVATNYHVAAAAKPRKIKGEKIIRRYFATGPNDEGASVNNMPGISPMMYSRRRDIAVFELRYPLRHHRGVSYSMDEVQRGQRVDIYAYPLEGINPLRNLLTFPATFRGETIDGLLAFDYSPSAGNLIKGGASGGIVVDRHSQQIVGVLNSIGKNGEMVACAVPISSLADLVNKIDPIMGETLFPVIKSTVSPMWDDFHPKLPPLIRSHVRTSESDDIKLLRSKAQLLSDGMNNFIAVETFEWGTRNQTAAVSAYEVQIVDGRQQFREYPDGKKQFDHVPFPLLNNSVVTAGEWSELPKMVGTDLHLRIEQATGVEIGNKRIKVFQYQADVEDELCRFLSQWDFGVFTINNVATASCYGEVWTDEDINILRISSHYELGGKNKDYIAVVTYGWLDHPGEAPRVVPLTISGQVGIGKKVHWCRGRFIDYKVFASRVKVIPK
jgi:hypothetical protein